MTDTPARYLFYILSRLGAPRPAAVLLLLCLLCPAVFAAFAQTPSSQEINLANEYYNDGEYERALGIYERVVKAYPQVSFYNERIIECYVKLERYDDALGYLDDKLKKEKDAPGPTLALKGKVLEKSGRPEEAKTLWDEVIGKKLRDLNDFHKVGSFFMNQQKYKYALRVYEKGRETLKNDDLFSSQMAYLYQFNGDFEAATNEYVKVYLKNNNQYDYARSQIMRMVNDDREAQIERALLNQAAARPNDVKILELLYDFYLKAQNYYEALVQARSIDRKQKEYGERVYKLAETLQNNEQYDLSNEALDYIIDNYEDSRHYYDAYIQRAKNFELKALDAVPVDTADIRSAVRNYDQLLDKFGRLPQLYEAMHRKARLVVFYLDDLDRAMQELQFIEDLNLPPSRKADSQLLMGDVYLMQGEYAKARLKYADVEKDFENTQTGAKAKFRSAQLAYFKGDFEAAKAYLSVLRENTSNDIANDAIRLFLTIQDNTGLDTTTVALERFAAAQLSVYQKNYDEALARFDSIAYNFPNHALADDILWEKSQILINQKKLTEAIELLDKILEKHGEDVYADDALFKKAEIYEFALGKKEKAEELYFELLLKYPASLYKVEARKRVRRLRGAIVN